MTVLTSLIFKADERNWIQRNKLAPVPDLVCRIEQFLFLMNRQLLFAFIFEFYVNPTKAQWSLRSLSCLVSEKLKQGLVGEELIFKCCDAFYLAINYASELVDFVFLSQDDLAINSLLISENFMPVFV